MTFVPSNVKFKLYVRAAYHHRFRGGKRIEASQNPNHNPLTLSDGTPVHTAFFTIDAKVPGEMLKESGQPTVEVEIENAVGVTPEVDEGEVINGLPG